MALCATHVKAHLPPLRILEEGGARQLHLLSPTPTTPAATSTGQSAGWGGRGTAFVTSPTGSTSAAPAALDLVGSRALLGRPGGVPVEVVRYEDMRLDTEATFTRAVRFAGLPGDNSY